MIINIEGPKGFSRKNKYNDATGYKINMQYWLNFANDEPSEREIKTYCVWLHQKNIPRNKFKEVKDLYVKTSATERNWILKNKTIQIGGQCLWSGRTNIANMVILPKAV